MYILYLYFLFICIFFFFLELIYSVDIADEEPHFVGYSVVNHYLLTYLLTYLVRTLFLRLLLTGNGTAFYTCSSEGTRRSIVARAERH